MLSRPADLRPVHGRRLERHIQRAFAEVEQFVLQQNDRFIAANGLTQLPPGILGCGGHRDAQTGNVHQHLLQPLGVLRGELFGHASRHPHHQRHGKLSPGHEGDLGRHVDDGVEGEQCEVDGHDLHHRAQARQCSSHPDPGKTALGDGGIPHPPLPVLGIEPFGDPITATVQADILTQHDHRLVSGQFCIQRPVERLPVKDLLCHQISTSPCRLHSSAFRASSQSGSGLSFAKRTAASTSSATAFLIVSSSSGVSTSSWCRWPRSR